MNTLELEERREKLKGLIGGSLFVPFAYGTSDLTNVLESVSDAPYKICTVVWSDGQRMNYYLWEVEPQRINPLTIQKTERGFDYVQFKDRYGATCSLQKSSLATEDAIWLGVDNADPKIMRSQAEAFGIDVGEGPEARNGWITFPIPKEVSLTTRMHLTQAMVVELLPFLKRFAESGELE